MHRPTKSTKKLSLGILSLKLPFTTHIPVHTIPKASTMLQNLSNHHLSPTNSTPSSPPNPHPLPPLSVLQNRFGADRFLGVVSLPVKDMRGGGGAEDRPRGSATWHQLAKHYNGTRYRTIKGGGMNSGAVLLEGG